MSRCFSPTGAQGGSMEPPKKTTFPAEFCDEYYTIDLYTKDNHIQAKKVKNIFKQKKIIIKLKKS